LLVREPRRLRLLTGKMAALLVFVTVSGMLTLLVSAALIIGAARSQDVSTAAWTSVEAIQASLGFAVNEVLCLVGISVLGMLVAYWPAPPAPPSASRSRTFSSQRD
jgi:hypothetical protein